MNSKSFIEVQFPVSKLSKESYKERKANLGQTLTGLGKWWGRKPLVMVRAALIGLLMPASDEPRKDMEIFLKIMTMNKQGLLNRKNKALPPKAVFDLMTTRELEQYFNNDNGSYKSTWKAGLSSEDKSIALEKAWSRMAYDQKLVYCMRPEEFENDDPKTWTEINTHLGTSAVNLQELVEQLGVKRFGHSAVVGDCFCGGGSVPFEAARIGCDVFASDLNPIAGLLTWASLNIAGASDEKVAELREFQQKIYDAVDKQIVDWGIETNEKFERANSYLYCCETTCPECGHIVPLAPSWVIGKGTKTAAYLSDNGKGFDIDIKSGLSDKELTEADKIATVRGSNMFCPHCLKTVPIASLRKKSTGETSLRLWAKDEFIPRKDDVFRERLYCIRYTGHDGKRYYTAPTAEDLMREEKVIQLLTERFTDRQEKGFIPSVAIEEGDETTRLLRERGWKYWHQLFNPRQLLVHGSFAKKIEEFAESQEEIAIGVLGLNKLCNWNSKLCGWINDAANEKGRDTFYNQALNTFYNGLSRTLATLSTAWFFNINNKLIDSNYKITIADARVVDSLSNIWLTDPPYADAINYHELSEFFLAWDKALLAKAFPEWYTDSKRVLAVQGREETFNDSMIEIYKNLTNNMPDDGMQIIMFTHQDVSVWADLRNIVWAAGLQVTAAWTIATETESGGLKSGNYVKGTVLLVLRKRVSSATAYLDEIMIEVEDEVKAQISSMRQLDDINDPNFTDADYILAAYAASLKVLTSYASIDGEDINRALKNSNKGVSVSKIIKVIESAKKIAYDQLLPAAFEVTPEKQYTWKMLTPAERFCIKGLELEKNSIYQLSAYQELARGYGVNDYKDMMGNTKANAARLKTPQEWAARSISGEGFAGSLLRHVLMALYQALKSKEGIVAGKNWLKNEVATYNTGGRKIIIDLLDYLSTLEHISNMGHWRESAAAAQIIKTLVENDGV